MWIYTYDHVYAAHITGLWPFTNYFMLNFRSSRIRRLNDCTQTGASITTSSMLLRWELTRFLGLQVLPLLDADVACTEWLECLSIPNVWNRLFPMATTAAGLDQRQQLISFLKTNILHLSWKHHHFPKAGPAYCNSLYGLRCLVMIAWRCSSVEVCVKNGIGM